MIGFSGNDFFGKVDRVPGLFFVATVFYYSHLTPLVPRRSYLLRDDHSGVGVEIPLSWKSVFYAYLRVVMAGGAVVLGMLAVCILATPNTLTERFLSAAGVAVSGVGAVLLWWMTFRLSEPSLARAIQLGQWFGLEEETVMRFYANLRSDETTAQRTIDMHKHHLNRD